MPRKPVADTDRQRAPRGSVTSRLILSLDRETERILAAALVREQEAGRSVNASEWIRCAIRERAERLDPQRSSRAAQARAAR